MKTILMHGIVGREITAENFSNELANSSGDIFLDLKSGGGLITEGIAIMNDMKNYNKGKIIARISYAASMATQIALTADEVQIYDNSVFMIHNALGAAMGDYRDMDKQKKILQSLSNLLAKTYVKKTGKSSNQILKMMDDETYLFGDEILKNGFADKIIDGSADENKNKDDAIAYAILQMEDVKNAIKNENITLDQLVACVGNCGVNLEEENTTPAFKDYPIIDREWDSNAAIKRVRAFLGAEEKPNTRYREAFFWYNNQESENFGAYKLPYVDVVEGQLVANIRGVNAANSAMAGARGGVAIPEADRPQVQAHIDKYRTKWQKEQQGEANTNAFNQNQKEKRPMTLAQLRNEHPELFAEAVILGVNQERERVTAHLTMGEAAGDLGIAAKNIVGGAEFNATVNAQYMAAQMKKIELDNRTKENAQNVNTPNNPTNRDEDEEDAKALEKALNGGI